jgi:hypothetical protein
VGLQERDTSHLRETAFCFFVFCLFARFLPTLPRLCLPLYVLSAGLFGRRYGLVDHYLILARCDLLPLTLALQVEWFMATS